MRNIKHFQRLLLMFVLLLGAVTGWAQYKATYHYYPFKINGTLYSPIVGTTTVTNSNGDVLTLPALENVPEQTEAEAFIDSYRFNIGPGDSDKVWANIFQFNWYHPFRGGDNVFPRDQIKTIEILNEGAVADWVIDEGAISEDCPITALNWDNFGGFRELEEVIFPSSVIRLESHSFQYSTIKRIDLSNIIDIRYGAFENTTRLSDVTIYHNMGSDIQMTRAQNWGHSNQHYGQFWRAPGLQKVTFTRDVTVVPSYCFNRCPNLKSIDWGGIKSIGDYAFQDTGLDTIDIANVDTIADGAFYNTHLKEVTIDGHEGQFIGNYAFCSNNYLEKVTINSNFAPDDKIRTYKGYDQGLDWSSTEQFQSCRNLKTVVLSDAVTSLPYCIFQNCPSLTDINLDNITTYGDYCLQGTSSLVVDTLLDWTGKEMKIGQIAGSNSSNGPSFKLIHIDDQTTLSPFQGYSRTYTEMFRGVQKSNIYIEDTDPTKYDKQEMIVKNGTRWDKTNRIFVPATSLDAWKAADGWSEIKDQIFPWCEPYIIVDGDIRTEGVKYTCDDETMTASLKKPGDKTSGTTVEIPNTIMSLADKNDPSTAQVYTVTGIDTAACHQAVFQKVVLPSTIKTIRKSAFSKSALNEINFPEGIDSIGDYAFSETHLKSVYLPGSLSGADVVYIDANDPSKGVDFENSTFAIGKNAFLKSENLQRVDIAEGVVGIGDNAFQFVPELTVINLPNSLKYIGAHFACGASKMEKLTIPSSVTDINGAFLHGCESLRKVYLLGEPSMLKLTSRGGESFGPVDPEQDWEGHDGYTCKHVNDCEFYVNDEQTYENYIAYENADGKYPWLRLDRYDLDYNLYGSDNPAWANVKYYRDHTADFPKNYGLDGAYHENAYEDAYAAVHNDPGAKGFRAPVRRSRKAAGFDTYTLTGYHNRYVAFDNDYTVTIKDGKWSTICFPFKPDANDLRALIGEDGIVAELVSAKLDRTDPMTNIPEQDYMYNLTFNVIPLADIEPDKPYLIRPSVTEDVEIPMYNNELEETKMTPEHWTAEVKKTVTASDDIPNYYNETKVSMIGTYQEYLLSKAEFYLNNYRKNSTDPWSMKFYKSPADNAVNVPPFKCYFNITKNGIPITNARMGTSFTLEEETTGIREFRQESFEPKVKVSGVYNLSGQRIADDATNLPAGFYIIDGKKVIIRK